MSHKLSSNSHLEWSEQQGQPFPERVYLQLCSCVLLYLCTCVLVVVQLCTCTCVLVYLPERVYLQLQTPGQPLSDFFQQNLCIGHLVRFCQKIQYHDLNIAQICRQIIAQLLEITALQKNWKISDCVESSVTDIRIKIRLKGK